MNRLLPGVGWNCTKADVRLRTPDDGQKGCPKRGGVVIQIKLEFSAPVDFIHKESAAMRGHTIIKFMYSSHTKLLSTTPASVVYFSTDAGK